MTMMIRQRETSQNWNCLEHGISAEGRLYRPGDKMASDLNKFFEEKEQTNIPRSIFVYNEHTVMNE